MREPGFVLFSFLLVTATVAFAGCVERVTVPPDSGEIIESPQKLPGAGEPYVLEDLPAKSGSERGEAEKREESSE